VSRRPELQIVAPNASAEEAATMAAAIEQFVRDTAPEPAPPADVKPSPWKRAALAEGIARQPQLPPQ
jgi:hypothetical protein